MEKPSLFERLKTRWGLTSLWQVLVVLLVFALTGFSAMYAKKPIFYLLGITPQTPVWVRIGVWLVTILPIYQILLLFYGFLLGQFTFFWNFEKKTFGRIAGLFGRKRTKKEES